MIAASARYFNPPLITNHPVIIDSKFIPLVGG
jgi:hypothetical protein